MLITTLGFTLLLRTSLAFPQHTPRQIGLQYTGWAL
jgi:hypothetical protein